MCFPVSPITGSHLLHWALRSKPHGDTSDSEPGAGLAHAWSPSLSSSSQMEEPHRNAIWPSVPEPSPLFPYPLSTWLAYFLFEQFYSGYSKCPWKGAAVDVGLAMSRAMFMSLLLESGWVSQAWFLLITFLYRVCDFTSDACWLISLNLSKPLGSDLSESLPGLNHHWFMVTTEGTSV